MASNMFKKYTESKTREWDVPEGTEGGDAVVHAVSGQVGVALTTRGDGTRPAGIPGVTGGTVPNGGVGNKPNGSVVAVDGSWLFEVTGATDGDTTAAGTTATKSGTKVYAVVAAGKVTGLTTTAGSNKLFGIIDDGVIVNKVAPIKIGEVL